MKEFVPVSLDQKHGCTLYTQQNMVTLAHLLLIP